MTDLVERLRELPLLPGVALKTVNEAANEIERLRKEAHTDAIVMRTLVAQRAQDAAEINRLKQTNGETGTSSQQPWDATWTIS